MTTKVMAMMTMAAGMMLGQYRDGYGRPAGDPRDYDGYGYDEVYHAPPPPPVPAYSYSYRRPPMPGPGCVWVNGYWNFHRGRYTWMNGYWGRPPYGGAVWVAPRYGGGRFFAGFWSGPGRGGYGHGYRGGRGYRR